MAKYDIGTSNNYWKTEDTSLIKNVKNTKDGTSVQLKNNETMSATRTGNTPLEISLRAHAKNAHIFNGLQSASLISLGQLCGDDCIAILDKNEINILKGFFLKEHINKTDGLWDITI